MFAPNVLELMGGYGIGIQFVAEQCDKLFGIQPLIVQSATANSRNKLEKLQQDLKQSKIVLTTSLMQISILDTVGLVLVQNALPLAMPDYNAQLNNYTFLYNLISFVSSASYYPTSSKYGKSDYSIIYTTKT
jgi:hypothetical protein